MSQEKRIFLTTAILFGILLLWSVLVPAPKPPPRQNELPGTPAQQARVEPENPVPATLQAPAGEPTETEQLGPFRIGVGQESGGIRELEADGQPLLTGADPGLLLLSADGTDGEMRFQTRLENGQLITEGSVPEKLKLVRQISLLDNGIGYRLEARITATNVSASPIRIPLKMVAFRSLQASQHDKALLHGTVRTKEKAEELSVRPGQGKRFLPPTLWVASLGKSHAVVVQPSGWEQEATFHVEHRSTGGLVGWLEAREIQIPEGGSTEWRALVYAGPLALDQLEKAGLEEALSFGAFSGTARGLLRFLRWMEGRFHSYGWAICVLGAAVGLALAPVTLYSSWMSQRMMQKTGSVRPQEMRIRKEHKDNPQKMHQELMELYRKHRINPASGCLGCLPMLLTWPVYIALFQVLTRAPELTGARFLLIRDLAQPDRMIPLPGPLPLIGQGINVLPFLAVASILWQQKAMQQPDSMLTDEQKVQQQMMKKILPVMFLVIFYALPSGFMLYLVVNSALTAALQGWFKKPAP